MKIVSQAAAALIAFATISNAPALAHGEKKHANAVGEKGDPAKVSRTVNVSMTDNVFTPNRISIKAGETVRFVVRNDGELVHEFNIGTGRETDINTLTAMLVAATGFGGQPRQGPPAPGEQSRSSVDPSRAKKSLGWHPEVDLKSGLEETVGYFRAHPER